MAASRPSLPLQWFCPGLTRGPHAHPGPTRSSPRPPGAPHAGSSRAPRGPHAGSSRAQLRPPRGVLTRTPGPPRGTPGPSGQAPQTAPSPHAACRPKAFPGQEQTSGRSLSGGARPASGFGLRPPPPAPEVRSAPARPLLRGPAPSPAVRPELSPAAASEPRRLRPAPYCSAAAPCASRPFPARSRPGFPLLASGGCAADWSDGSWGGVSPQPGSAAQSSDWWTVGREGTAQSRMWLRPARSRSRGRFWARRRLRGRGGRSVLGAWLRLGRVRAGRRHGGRGATRPRSVCSLVLPWAVAACVPVTQVLFSWGYPGGPRAPRARRRCAVEETGRAAPSGPLAFAVPHRKWKRGTISGAPRPTICRSTRPFFLSS